MDPHQENEHEAGEAVVGEVAAPALSGQEIDILISDAIIDLNRGKVKIASKDFSAARENLREARDNFENALGKVSSNASHEETVFLLAKVELESEELRTPMENKVAMKDAIDNLEIAKSCNLMILHKMSQEILNLPAAAVADREEFLEQMDAIQLHTQLIKVMLNTAQRRYSAAAAVAIMAE